MEKVDPMKERMDNIKQKNGNFNEGSKDASNR